MSGAPPGRVVLIVSGGIAACKSLDLVRRLRAAGHGVTPVLTAAGARFVTPLSLQALAGERAHLDLWDAAGADGMDHIRLSRQAALIVVAPASADLLARMAAGLADDLATTLLLAADTPILVAPAMNARMWAHPATRANLALLRARGVAVVPPGVGAMACGEWGEGRMAEPAEIADAVGARLGPRPLAGRRAIVTSGPTHEPIDAVRVLANRSSGQQGHAVAQALAALGAEVALVSGPVCLPDPPDTRVHRVETAAQMLAACRAALPAEIAVCVAAVADWRPETPVPDKLKKAAGPPALSLVPTPDILAALSAPGLDRPRLVVGFAAETPARTGAETAHLAREADAKRLRKGCDWIVANDVGVGTGTMGGADNEVLLVTRAGAEQWPRLSKTEVARRLAARIASALDDAAADAP